MLVASQCNAPAAKAAAQAQVAAFWSAIAPMTALAKNILQGITIFPTREQQRPSPAIRMHGIAPRSGLDCGQRAADAEVDIGAGLPLLRHDQPAATHGAKLAAVGRQPSGAQGTRMIATSRVAARSVARASRTVATAVGLVGLLTALTACAAGNATSGLATPASSASAPPASAPPATASAAAAPAPPQHLTATQINEKCWMSTEKFKADDIDKRMKLVDKCVDDMKRAQGGG